MTADEALFLSEDIGHVVLDRDKLIQMISALSGEVRILRAQIERRCTCGAATSAAMMGTHSDSCPQYQRLPDTCYCGEAAPVPGSKHVACAKSYAAGLNDREREF